MKRTITVYKYQLDIADKQVIEVPAGAVFLTLQTQYAIPCIWLYVDAAVKEVQQIEIRTFGTGHFCDAPAELYLGSYQIEGGNLVFHVFGDIKRPRS